MAFCDAAAYSFFDSYDVEVLGRTRKRPDPHTIGKSVVKPFARRSHDSFSGKTIPLAEY